MFRRKGQVYTRVLAMAPFPSQVQSSCTGNTLKKASPTATLCSSQTRSTTRTTSTSSYSILSTSSAGSTSALSAKQASRSISSGSYRTTYPHHQHRTYYHHHAFAHEKPTRQHRDRSNSVYDPDLAACMDRWVRIVFYGQRRMNSSVAKSITTTASPSYPVIDVPIQPTVLNHRESSLADQSQKDQQQQLLHSPSSLTNTDNKKEMKDDEPSISLSTLRETMSKLPVGAHVLPLEFSSIKKRVPTAPVKHRFALRYQRKVDRLWLSYLALVKDQKQIVSESLGSESQPATLTRSDYTQLIQVLRHGPDPREAARRILTVKDALDRDGFKLTRKLGEVVIQAHLVLGSTDEIVPIYENVTRQVGNASLQHKRLIWTIVDGFATNRLFLQGCNFLDSLTAGDDDQDRALYHDIYRQFLTYRLQAEGPSTISAARHEALRVFYEWRFPVKAKALVEALDAIQLDNDGTRALLDFSTTTAGSLVKSGNSHLLVPLLVRLLRTGQVQEGNRVRTMMLHQGVPLEQDAIRVELLRSSEAGPDRENRHNVLHQWDQTASTAQSQYPMELEYSKLVARCLDELDLTGALGTAGYMNHRGWSAQEIDFMKLNSRMVNFASSDQYPLYLRIRYILGGTARPDLHTYRRLIYAACRRSDLASALEVFQVLRSRHVNWTLDTTLYNAILSTAAATGQIQVAEKMFDSLLKDGYKPDSYSFEGLLNGYAQSGNLKAALLIPEKMIKSKLSPTTKTFNLVMKAFLGARKDLSNSQKLLKVMQLSGGVVGPDLVTFNQLLEGYRLVGNTVWFDDYFDKYFGPKNRERRQLLKIQQNEGQIRIDEETKKRMLRRKQEALLIGPDNVDGETLLIQLRHSLALPDLDVAAVQELWQTVEPRLKAMPPSRSLSLPSIGPSTSTSASNPSPSQGPTGNEPCLPLSDKETDIVAHSLGQVLPETHVPFKKRLGRGDVIVPALDQDVFRYTTLDVFRDAFRIRGSVRGTNQVDRLLRKYFPNHPEVLARSKSLKKSE